MPINKKKLLKKVEEWSTDDLLLIVKYVRRELYKRKGAKRRDECS